MPFAEPGVKPHYAPSRTTKIVHLDLSLKFFIEEKRFEGRAAITLSALPSYTGVVSLDLDEVRVIAVTDAQGIALPWKHEDAELRITAADPGQVIISWEGTDPSCGLYFTGPKPSAPDRKAMAWTQCQDEDGHFVYPCHDHPGVKHTWSVRLEGPAGYTLLSNGAAIDSGESDGRAWSTWEQREPMPAYLFTAVAAQLSMVESSWRDRPVRYFVPVGSEQAVIRAMGKTPLMIEAFSQRTGVDYPWPRYDQVVVDDFIFGGMENVACTTMTDLLLVDAHGILEWDPDGLVSHELAHQWFGDLVTCQDWSQGWLNESWATYMEAVWWEADRGVVEATWYRFDTMADYLDEFSNRYRRPLVSYDFREPIDVFDRHLYQKGSCVLWTLLGILGEDAFWAGVKHYLETNAHSTVHSRDFQRAMEDTTGVNLDRFVHQFVDAPGHPEISVKLSSEEGLLIVDVNQTQTGAGVPEAYHFPLTLEVVTDSGVKTLRLPVRERARAWAIQVEGAIETVRIDPGLNVLATHTWKGPRSWFERLLSDPCPVVAARAVNALLDEGSATALDSVREAMTSHGFWGVRLHIAGKLGGLGGSQDRAALIAGLTGDADPRVQRACADGLGKFRDEGAADALIAMSKAPVVTWQLLGAVLRGLGATRDPRAIEILTPFLDIESWAETVRTRAIAGLAATQDPAVLDVILTHSSLDRDDRIRAAAASALGTLGDRVESVRDRALERLLEMLDEPGFRAQGVAISALATLGDPRALGVLGRVHRSAPDGRTRRLAYESMTRIQKGRTNEAGLASIRRELEAVKSENATLRERLDRLERR